MSIKPIMDISEPQARQSIARHLRCPVSDSKDVRSLREAKVALLTL
jgi:hypothetical protein